MGIAFLQGLSFAMAPLLSFGPFKLFVFSQALRHGTRRSLHLALVPLLADIPVIVLIWLVMRQFPDWALNLLRVTGGLFYIYLAFNLYRNAGRQLDEEAIENAPRRTFGQAITAVWVTPNVYINWSIIGVPALLEYASQSAASAVAFLLGFYLLWVGGFAAQIVLIGQAGKFSAQANRYLIYVAALVLVGFGIYLIGDGAYQFWASVVQ